MTPVVKPWRGWVFLAAGCVLAGGCIVIPANYHATGSRHNVSEKTEAALQAGVTTKEDTYLLLGEPDYVSEDGQRIGYGWRKVYAIWAIAAPGGGGASGEIEKSYLLQITFDASNRVLRVDFLKQWGPEISPARTIRN